MSIITGVQSWAAKDSDLGLEAQIFIQKLEICLY